MKIVKRFTLLKNFEKLISIFYEIELVNINFKTEKTKKNTYKKEYKKAISLIKPNSIVVAWMKQENHIVLSNFQIK